MLREEKGSFLIFARTKHGADKLAKKLSQTGAKTATIHGNRTQNQRNQALSGFQDGYYRVLVATDIAARGIHVEGIAHVVNYDLPQAPEDFIHRAGRTGRAGAGGTATTFATRAERPDISRIERLLATHAWCAARCHRMWDASRKPRVESLSYPILRSRRCDMSDGSDPRAEDRSGAPSSGQGPGASCNCC